MKTLGLLCFFFVYATCCSQSFFHKTYDAGNVLPSSQIYDVMQDKTGFIWIATDAGVVKYDGTNFTSYTSKEGLPSNAVFNLHEDTGGRIWFLSMSGMLSYHHNGKIIRYRYNDTLARYKGQRNPIKSIVVRRDGSILIGMINAGACIISAKGHLQNLPHSGDGLSYDYASGSLPEGDYHYGIQNNTTTRTKEGQIRFFENRKEIVPQTRVAKTIVNFFFIYRRNGHRLVAGSGMIFDTYQGKLCSALKTDNPVLSLSEDKDSCLWIGFANGGVKKYSPNAAINSKAEKLYFPDEHIARVLEDDQKGLWFATMENGLFYVPYKDLETLEPGMSDGKQKTLSIATDGVSRVFAGTNTGKLLVFGAGKLLSSYDLRKMQAGDLVYNLYYHQPSHNLYFTCNGLPFVLKNNGSPEPLPLPFVTCFLRLGDTLYCGSNQRILRFFKNELKPYMSAVDLTRATCLTTDVFGQLFAGTSSGLYHIVRDSLLPYHHLLKGSRISDILCEDSSLYLCTNNHGIVSWKGRLQSAFPENNGLAGAAANCLIKENDSVFWAATDAGLCKIDRKHKQVLFTLNHKKGLSGKEISRLILLHDTLYALSYEGISFFKTSRDFRNTRPPGIFIRDFLADTVSYISEQNPKLPYDLKHLSISISALSLRQDREPSYRYRLRGYDDQWKNTSSNTIQMLLIPHGTYTFEAIAVNEDGLASSEPACFAFTIATPFWKTTWFTVICFFLACLLMFIIFYVRLRYIHKENRIREQLAGYRQQALSLQMNPHFIFNSLSSIQSYVLSENPLKASKYLALFSRLMRKTLDHSRQEYIYLHEEIALLNLYLDLEAARASRDFQRSIHHEGVETERILIPPMLVQPHVENSVKHAIKKTATSTEGVIDISFFWQDQWLICRVSDNGPGFADHTIPESDKANGHHSAGIEITRTRLRLLCQNMRFPFHFVIKNKTAEDAGSSGALVEFIIPYRLAGEPDSSPSLPPDDIT